MYNQTTANNISSHIKQTLSHTQTHSHTHTLILYGKSIYLIDLGRQMHTRPPVRKTSLLNAWTQRRKIPAPYLLNRLTIWRSNRSIGPLCAVKAQIHYQTVIRQNLKSLPNACVTNTHTHACETACHVQQKSSKHYSHQAQDTVWPWSQSLSAPKATDRIRHCRTTEPDSGLGPSVRWTK